MSIDTLTYRVLVLAFLSIMIWACENESIPLPEINPEISPESGKTTSTYKFDLAKAFNYNQNNKLFVRWDWEGDSVFDTPFLHESLLQHRYYAPGEYFPRAEIKNLNGETSQADFYINVVQGYSAPRAKYLVYPDTGNIYTTFHFDASFTKDDEDSLSTLLFRWDFEGDGVWDTPLDTSSITGLS